MTDGIAFNRLADLLQSRGEPARYSGGALRTRGICHDGDADNTVAIKRGSNGGVVIFCHKCQGNAEFLDAIGWTEADLFDEPMPERERPDRPADSTWMPCTKDGHKRVAEYRYDDEQGGLVHGVVRCDRKDFYQWRPDPTNKSGRRWKLNDDQGKRLVRTIPYRLPHVLKAVAEGAVVWVCEGEKDVHALLDHGLAATCNAGGAGKWTAEHAAFFQGADVTIVADRDEPGEQHAKAAVETLRAIARSVYVVQTLTGKDAADHFEAGHNDTQFVQVWAPVPYPGDPVVAE
ncbi:toprim domain-containing protein [Streptomyces sp. H39-C1]|uniref:toprim domain-containing protein n=1 Tax=Streptomyces sp. H39-C1 TaxID=3004355 RepID=UPI0022B03EB0|nr:toprim domain-containing protein [Streptomyces sp. H39-C1]MCZ4099870.1 hypothetical protein [Streptomyces sp. H39-C1]